MNIRWCSMVCSTPPHSSKCSQMRSLEICLTIGHCLYAYYIDLFIPRRFDSIFVCFWMVTNVFFLQNSNYCRYCTDFCGCERLVTKIKEHSQTYRREGVGFFPPNSWHFDHHEKDKHNMLYWRGQAGINGLAGLNPPTFQRWKVINIRLHFWEDHNMNC